MRSLLHDIYTNDSKHGVGFPTLNLRSHFVQAENSFFLEVKICQLLDLALLMKHNMTPKYDCISFFIYIYI